MKKQFWCYDHSPWYSVVCYYNGKRSFTWQIRAIKDITVNGFLVKANYEFTIKTNTPLFIERCVA